MAEFTTLKQCLAAASMEDLGVYACQHCGRPTASDQLVDVRSMDDVPGEFVCRTVCASNKERELEQQAQEALPWPTPIQLADVRAAMIQRLSATDHLMLQDYQLDMSEEEISQATEYRAACRDVYQKAKEGVRVAFPDPIT